MVDLMCGVVIDLCGLKSLRIHWRRKWTRGSVRVGQRDLGVEGTRMYDG